MASFVVAVLRQIAQHQVVARLALQHLGEGVAAHGGLDGILHVGDVDLVARGLLAVHREVQVGLAEDAKDSEVLDSFDLAHDVDDLSALSSRVLQVVAIDLRGQLAFHAADRLFHVVLDGLGEAPDHAGNLLQLAVHGGDQFVLVLVKDGPPLFLGLQVDEVFGVEEARGVGSVVRPPDLARALR